MLMLIASIRALTWHKVSQPLTGMLLVLALFAAWQLLTHSGPISAAQWGLFILCALVGLVVGLVRGQCALLRFVPSEGDVLCRRGALLIFCWAATAITLITLLSIPSSRMPAWEAALPPALAFLTAAFVASTLTIFARVSALRRESHAQLEQERLAH